MYWCCVLYVSGKYCVCKLPVSTIEKRFFRSLNKRMMLCNRVAANVMCVSIEKNIIVLSTVLEIVRVRVMCNGVGVGCKKDFTKT